MWRRYSPSAWGVQAARIPENRPIGRFSRPEGFATSHAAPLESNLGTEKAPAAGCARGGSREKGAPMEAYCVKCKAKREMADPVAGVTKNGKPITKGKCPVCGTTVCRIGKPAE